MESPAPLDEALLLQSREFLLRQTNVGFMRRDLDGRILEVNEPLCALLERTPAELISCVATELVAELRVEAATFEVDLTSKTGIRRRVQVTTAPLIIGSATAGFLDALVDLTGHRAMKSKLVEEVQLMSRLASTDSLTGLSNRNAFLESLGLHQEEESQGQYAVVIADLDQFKTINDRLGHAAGDEALVQFARKLASAVRDSDVVARLGGDEFAVLLPRATFSVAAEIVGRLRDSLQFEFEFEGSRIEISASVGWAHCDEGKEQVLRLADERMYQEKRRSTTP